MTPDRSTEGSVEYTAVLPPVSGLQFGVPRLGKAKVVFALVPGAIGGVANASHPVLRYVPALGGAVALRKHCHPRLSQSCMFEHGNPLWPCGHAGMLSSIRIHRNGPDGQPLWAAGA